jgi:hypothetical protein
MDQSCKNYAMTFEDRAELVLAAARVQYVNGQSTEQVLTSAKRSGDILEYLSIVDRCAHDWFQMESTWGLGFAVNPIRSGASGPAYIALEVFPPTAQTQYALVASRPAALCSPPRSGSSPRRVLHPCRALNSSRC